MREAQTKNKAQLLEFFPPSQIVGQEWFLKIFNSLRPYHVERTPSRPIWQVKQRWAGLVLGPEMAWEFPVLYAVFLGNFQ